MEKLFHGTCTETELETLFHLIRQDPAPPAPDLMERLWDAVQPYPVLREEVRDRVFGRIMSKIGPVGKKVAAAGWEEGTIKALNRSGQGRRSILSIAAAVLLVVVGGAFWIFSNNKKTVEKTTFGEWKTLEFSDGSKVKLNANSEMSFKEDWGTYDDREIWLNGEAYFEVKKKPETDQKLKVLTNDLTIEVLGTSFNVSSKGGRTSVYLVEGKILLYLNALGDTISMEPGDLIEYSVLDETKPLKSKDIADLHTSWKEGHLTFRGTPLREVFQEVEAIYDVKFDVKDSTLSTVEYNFDLPINEFQKTIDILKKTLRDLEFRQNGNSYTVE